jgi:hypothetical protein
MKTKRIAAGSYEATFRNGLKWNIILTDSGRWVAYEEDQTKRNAIELDGMRTLKEVKEALIKIELDYK